jgi:predicted permease
MIGLLLRFEFQRDYMGDICRILGVRHAAALALALVGYYVLPFDTVIRRTLVLISFAPISAVAPAYTGMCGGDEGKAGAANSISIILSVIEITILLIIMKLY